MFCDLSGSTKLSTQLDPEDLYSVLSSYRTTAAEVITGLGGTVAQYLGDGILAFFGYPTAYEDDAERAVRSGLEVVRQASALQTQLSQHLRVRVGIATGLVVVGEQDGAPQSGEKSAVGEALNLAARLQALAPENGVVIAESTRRLIGTPFELREVSIPEAKGFADPITAFSVTGLSPVDGRYEGLRSGERTTFVGREEEVALLLRRWTQITQGEGRVVLLQGDPGIGKSRIVDQVCTELHNSAHSCLRFFGSRLHTQSALHPVTRQIQRSANIAEGDGDDEKLAKISQLFSSASGDSETEVRLIANLLGIAKFSKELDALGPVQKREKLLNALLNYPFILAKQNPVLIVFEDAHWMDPTSLDLLDRLAALIAEHPILLVVCARPEYQPAWADHSAVTLLSLNRLGFREGAAMISGIARGKTLPPNLTEQILNRGDGVPLIIEELTKTVLESGGLIEQADSYALRGSLPTPALPGSLHASLVARLDRQPPNVKNLVQIGAVIGREFAYKVLESVAGLPSPEIEEGLTKLAGSGLIHRRGKGPDAVYVFKHALVQDAAYSTLLKGRRQHIHAAIARTLLDKFPALAASQPEVLAHHLTVACDFPAAIQFWLAAGRSQIRASADLEGIQHLQRGIELIGEITDPSLARELELPLQAALIGPLVAVEGPCAPAVARCCERGLQLATAGSGSPYVFPFLYGHFTYLVSTGQLRNAVAIAGRFIETAKRASYESGVVIGHRLLGLALLALGDFKAAKEALDTSLALYDPDRDENVTFLYGQNAKVNSQAVLSLTLFLLGDVEKARDVGSDCLRAANRLKHPHSMAIAITYVGCWLLHLGDDVRGMSSQAERLVAITEEYGLGIFATVGHFFIGWAQFRRGETEAGIAGMQQAVATFDRGGFRLAVCNFLCMLAEAQRSAGHLREASAACKRAKDTMAECDERWYEPEILCVEAHIGLASGELSPDEAANLLQRAIERARALSSPTLVTRCLQRQDSLFPKQLVS